MKTIINFDSVCSGLVGAGLAMVFVGAILHTRTPPTYQPYLVHNGGDLQPFVVEAVLSFDDGVAELMTAAGPVFMSAPYTIMEIPSE